MRERKKIVIDRREFYFNEREDGNILRAVDRKAPEIMCPECLNTKFEISYGDYQLICICNCGHTMVVYDG